MPTKYLFDVSIALTFQNSREDGARVSLSERELIRNAQAGDVESFAQLASRFERRIYTLALHYTRNRSDAEDLSQEVWLKAFKALDQFRNEASFYTWLRRIMVNTFLNYRRTIAALYESDNPVNFLEPESANADLSSVLQGRSLHLEDQYQQKMLVERVMRALGDLTPQQRLIFLLKHREGMTYEEISKSLGCSTGTVKKALFRTVTRLREQLSVTPPPLERAHCGSAGGSTRK